MLDERRLGRGTPVGGVGGRREHHQRVAGVERRRIERVSADRRLVVAVVDAHLPAVEVDRAAAGVPEDESLLALGRLRSGSDVDELEVAEAGESVADPLESLQRELDVQPGQERGAGHRLPDQRRILHEDEQPRIEDEIHPRSERHRRREPDAEREQSTGREPSERLLVAPHAKEEREDVGEATQQAEQVDVLRNVDRRERGAVGHRPHHANDGPRSERRDGEPSRRGPASGERDRDGEREEIREQQPRAPEIGVRVPLAQRPGDARRQRLADVARPRQGPGSRRIGGRS
ncbi:hypothetical protein ACFQJD_06060 [Haloplanus sp. GCM10025708]|uniref:hypothetical protein n=1 Tax=Haloplanus sp. GCM10025708 TaxID=3252679 RepID=UPI00361E2AB7